MKFARLTILVLLLAAGCTSTPQKPETAVRPLPEGLLPDVGINIFTGPVSSSAAKYDAEIRKAEGIYISYHLAKSILNHQQLGPVRIIPDKRDNLDINISGEVVYSDGEVLELVVKVEDASGKRWYKKNYRQVVSQEGYINNNQETADPFSKLYESITLDLIRQIRGMSYDELTNIKNIRRLRFARWLMPGKYSDYYSQGKNGIIHINRLPPENDPYAARINRINSRYNLYVDTQMSDYGNFVDRIYRPYFEWRKNSLNNKILYRKSRADASRMYFNTAKDALFGLNPLNIFRSIFNREEETGIAAGLQDLEAANNARYDSKMYVETIKELSESFNNDLKTENISIENHTLQLSGNVLMRYLEFKRILREMYNTESGR